jgi:cytochrome P450
MATDDVEISGEKVSKGDYLLLLLGSANRDELVFTDPAQLLIDRNPNPHVAFSLGPHYCLGAHLARLETQIAIRRLLECAPKLRRLNADEPLTYRPGLFIRSMERLEVVF